MFILDYRVTLFNLLAITKGIFYELQKPLNHNELLLLPLLINRCKRENWKTILPLSKSSLRLLVLLPNFVFAMFFVCNVYAEQSYQIRYSDSPEKTRVVLEFNDVIEFNYYYTNDKSSFVLSLASENEVNQLANLLSNDLTTDVIANLTYRNILKKNNFNLVFNLINNPDIKVFDLLPNNTTGYRIIIDFIKNSSFLIAIDPGHGGIDLGSISGKTIFEKDLVLHVAKYLKNSLLSVKNLDVVLTRQDDYFVYPSQRQDITQRKDADLFISLHADQLDEKNPQQISVWFYQDIISNSTLANLLTKNESESILLGNVADLLNNDPQKDNLLLSNYDQKTKSALDLHERFANLIADELNNAFNQNSTMAQPINLVVLESDKQPSILINLDNSFVINYGESLVNDEKKETMEVALEKLATAIISSAKKYQESL